MITAVVPNYIYTCQG